MEKYVYTLIDFLHRVSKTPVSAEEKLNFETSDNIKSFSLPDIEPTANEVSGYSGLNGKIQVTDWADIGALDMSLTYSTMPECKALYSPEKQTHSLTWVEQYTDKNGDVGYVTYTAEGSGMLKKIPGGDRAKGENSDKEFTIALNSYKLTRKYDTEAEATVIIDYDPVNKKLTLGGTDFAAKLNTAMASF